MLNPIYSHQSYDQSYGFASGNDASEELRAQIDSELSEWDNIIIHNVELAKGDNDLGLYIDNGDTEIGKIVFLSPDDYYLQIGEWTTTEGTVSDMVFKALMYKLTAPIQA